MSETQHTEQRPHYSKFREEHRSKTGPMKLVESHNLFGVQVDEGWRSSVVCSGMYEWAADWLVDQLQSKPYAPETRP